MTRDEAVRTLQSMKSDFPLPKAAQTRRTQNEALDVAIEVLKAESCDDTISRQAAIDALKEHRGLYCDDSPNTFSQLPYSEKCRVDELDTAIATLVNLPSAQPEQRWIPCSEKPSEEGRDVLITKESFKIRGYEQEVIKAKRSADPRSGKIEWWSPEFGTLTNKAVLAWMPLPEPYKEERQ